MSNWVERILIVAVLLSGTLSADLKSAKEHYLKGKEAFDEKRYEDALDDFHASLMEDPDNLMLNYLIGQAAYEQGEYEEALFAYERALVIDPKHARSRLEKARTHLALGSKQEARKELNTVLESNVPPDVRNTVESLLARLGSERKHQFGGVVALSHTFDSNANLGTTEFIPSPFTPSLVSNPTKTDDRIAAVALVLNHSYPLSVENLTWKNGAIFYLSDNDKITSNDLFLITVNSGAVYAYKRHLFEGQIAFSHIRTSWNLFQQNYRFLFKYVFNMSKKFQFISANGYTKRHHFGTAATFGLVTDSTGTIIYIHDPKRTFTGSLLVRYDKTPNAGAPADRYYRFQGTVAFNQTITDKWSTNSSAQLRLDRYQNQHAVRPEHKRSDDAYVLAGGVAFKVRPKVILGASTSFTHNHSNIIENNYNSWKLTTTATGIF